jgi:hypothetical protein
LTVSAWPGWKQGPMALCQLNFKQVLGIQSLNKRLIKYVIKLIFIGRVCCFFTYARVLETFYGF